MTAISPIVWVLLAIIVILAILYFAKKNNADKQVNQIQQISPQIIEPCVPFTQKQYDDAVRILRSKCGAQLLIPIVGIGAYNTCMAKGKASIPEIKIC